MIEAHALARLALVPLPARKAALYCERRYGTLALPASLGRATIRRPVHQAATILETSKLPAWPSFKPFANKLSASFAYRIADRQRFRTRIAVAMITLTTAQQKDDGNHDDAAQHERLTKPK